MQEFKVYVPPASIARVMASAIEHELTEFTISDDRGGSGCWALMVTDEFVSRKELRAVVGPHLHIEEV